MFKWLGKQFAYGRIYLWAKERLSGILLTLILLILVFYIHSEYLNYIEFKSKNLGSYIGLSFVIKNILILVIVFGYLYFYRTINKTKQSIKHTKQVIREDKNIDDKERVKSLDEFLSDDEIDR
tara:strand:- start:318 stop:686 length:369 start_codon:yes stop_codon:yes gene_type:complete